MKIEPATVIMFDLILYCGLEFLTESHSSTDTVNWLDGTNFGVFMFVRKYNNKSIENVKKEVFYSLIFLICRIIGTNL